MLEGFKNDLHGSMIFKGDDNQWGAHDLGDWLK